LSIAAYLSENPDSAPLEVSVHTAANDVPSDFTLLGVEEPDIATATVTADDWPRIGRLIRTREFGTAWLSGNERVLLKIPSAIVHPSWNLLFNPLHADAGAFRIEELLSYPFFNRIKQ
jgi:RES domain-containing protein